MVCCGAVHGQVAIDSFPFNYSQDFDTLETGAATDHAWSDNSTLAGWYVAASGTWDGTYQASAGNSFGRMFSLGSDATDTERALGSNASATTGAFAYGLRLINNSASPITEISVSYVGEQWRASHAVNETLELSYRIGNTSTDLTDPEPGTSAGPWTVVPALTFNSPQDATGGSIIGNDSANRQLLSTTISLGGSLDPNEEIFLRWRDVNDSGSNHTLGIDELTISAVPEPHVYAAVGGLLLLSFALLRR
jgi:hypothetical protein